MATSVSVSMSTDTKAQSMLFAQRWAAFVMGLWLMALSGTFGFSNYSTALKEILGLNQKQLNRLSVAKDLGDACGVMAGILSNYLPPAALLCIGAVICFLGNGIQWLVVAEIISVPPYWAMFVVSMLAGNTDSWMNTSVFPLAVANFPRNRGPVVGLYKAYMGISAAVFSSFCDNFFSSSASMYLLMLTTIPPVFCLITAFFVRPVPPAETPEEIKAEQQSLSAFTVISIALALLLVVQNLVPAVKQGAIRPVYMTVVFVVLAAPALVPMVLFFSTKREYSSKGTADSILGAIENRSDSLDVSTVESMRQGEDTHVQSPSDNDASIDDMEKDALSKPLLITGADSKQLSSSSSWKLGEDRSTLSLLKTWHGYVLYLSFFCGGGLGISFSNNLGQVGQSFGFSTITLFTSLFSLGNFFGRIASGNISEYFLNAKGTPRPAWLGVAKVPMIAMFAWLSLGSAASLYAGSFILGFAHGTVITLAIPILSEFYGLRYFGMNYMVMNTHLLAGSTVFSGLVAGYLYDIHATSEDDSGTLTCYGSSCFGTTFLFFAGVLVLALSCDGLLTFFSRALYKNIQDINTKGVLPKKE